MNNPLFNLAGNPMQLLAQLRNNPIGVLRQKGFNIPDNMTNPQAIIQHLMNSGQVSQEQFNQAMQMAQNFKF